MRSPSRRRVSNTARSWGVSFCAFAALTAPAVIVASAASAATTTRIQGCYTTWVPDTGHAVCNNVPTKVTVNASGNCYNWPGVVGGSATFSRGQGSSGFSYIACSTQLVEGFINVYYNGGWHQGH